MVNGVYLNVDNEKHNGDTYKYKTQLLVICSVLALNRKCTSCHVGIVFRYLHQIIFNHTVCMNAGFAEL